VDPIIESVKDKLDANAPLSAIVEHLGGREGFTLTPFNLIRVLHQASGISVSDLQKILATFDARLQPIESWSDVDRVGEAVLERYRR
jgi:hypothetical protein